jgi:hypothetical protein
MQNALKRSLSLMMRMLLRLPERNTKGILSLEWMRFQNLIFGSCGTMECQVLQLLRKITEDTVKGTSNR